MATAVGSYSTAAEFKRLAGITDTTDDTLIGLICDRVNQWIETFTDQPIAPITSATYTYNGNGLTHIFLPAPLAASTKGIGGMRAVTLVEYAPYTAGTFETITAGDYALHTRATVGGPYLYLRTSDIVTGSYSTFPEGRANIRITGTAGWAAIPDDVTMVAIDLTMRAWNARQTSEADVPISSFATSGHKATLKPYKLRYPQ